MSEQELARIGREMDKLLERAEVAEARVVDLEEENERLKEREAYLVERFDGHQRVIGEQQRDAFRLLARIRRNAERAWRYRTAVLDTGKET